MNANEKTTQHSQRERQHQYFYAESQSQALQMEKSRSGTLATARSDAVAAKFEDSSSSEMDQSNHYSSDALAEGFSSSLAQIVSKEQRRSQKSSRRLKSENTSEYYGNDSSGSSGLNSGATEGNIVTVTATASSGDDRDSSASGSRLPGDDGNVERGNATKLQESLPDAALERHHFHHQRKRPLLEGKRADDYGLPVHLEDRFYENHFGPHRTVVAHLPPPGAETSSASSADGESSEYRAKDSISLLEPHREPAFHTIRTTFVKFSQRRQNKSSETDSSADQMAPYKHKKGKKRSMKQEPSSVPEVKKKRMSTGRRSDYDVAGNGSTSGSGTEGGYAGSASSNGRDGQIGADSSPSVSSSEESLTKVKRKRGQLKSLGDPPRHMLRKKLESLSSSSEIADFSSGMSESEAADENYIIEAFRETASESLSISSSSGGDPSSDEQEEDTKLRMGHMKQILKHENCSWTPLPLKLSTKEESEYIHRDKRVYLEDDEAPKCDQLQENDLLEGKTPILTLGCDVMAHVLTFLEPPDILDVLTMPLSTGWTLSFTKQPELWRVLCLLPPFKAPVEIDGDESSDESEDSFPVNMEKELGQAFGKFRLLYTSFVKCMRYLARIKDDAIHGRSPNQTEYGINEVRHDIGSNRNLHEFLARARGYVVHKKTSSAPEQLTSDTDESDAEEGVARAKPIGVSDDGSSTNSITYNGRLDKKHAAKNVKNKYAHSNLTQRLLGPSKDGDVGHTELPWSCAIYSIVNWMVAFSDVEGILTMCLKILPFILENEQQRVTAQRAGLTDVVLRAMVMFPDSAQLHTTAFHTIVLLARPLGGKEGMLFHTSMVNSSGIFGAGPAGSKSGKNGIAVMLDSMKRYIRDGDLQAMSCWSLVNIALVPAQKEVLVRLGGIEVTARAMMEHPYNAEVQFRALFALINLVIPSINLNQVEVDDDVNQELQLAQEEGTDKDLLDEMVNQVVSLVVLAMKNFCASEAILNRACLVLHNLSLTQGYHHALLWTPNCYQMLEWCLANYRTDQVLQQSAAGTLHRLQITLSSDEDLRTRFRASIQAQQQLSLEQAHREAVILHEQHARQIQQQHQNTMQ